MAYSGPDPRPDRPAMRETLRAARLPSGKPTEADKPRLVTFPDTPAAREAKRNPQDERLW